MRDDAGAHPIWKHSELLDLSEAGLIAELVGGDACDVDQLTLRDPDAG